MEVGGTECWADLLQKGSSKSEKEGLQNVDILDHGC